MTRQVTQLMYVRNITDNTWIPGMIKKQHGLLSYHMKLQDGRMVCRHSDNILAHSETEIALVADDDWLNLPDVSQDSATAQSQSSWEQTNDLFCPPLQHSTRPSIPPKWYGHDYKN